MSTVETRLIEVVAGVLSLPSTDLTDETGRGDVPGWNSLAHLQLAAAVEDVYAVRLTPREIRGFRTVGDLRALLGERGATP